ncbi:MAG: nucleotidyltransferase family protein, partial [Clostridia bacterium]|nr:nucleotidyltransferase family protein [Clostridia bacterium]
MNFSFMQAVVALVKSAIDGSRAELPSDIDWNQLYIYSKKQTLAPLVYYGLIESEIDIPDEIRQAFDKRLLSHILVDQRQQFELAKIYEAFDKDSIEYMPIKGAVLRPIYPKTEMRPMGDADILIRIQDKDRVEADMIRLGFVSEKESAHEYVFNKGDICIEIHKCL